MEQVSSVIENICCSYRSQGFTTYELLHGENKGALSHPAHVSEIIVFYLTVMSRFMNSKKI